MQRIFQICNGNIADSHDNKGHGRTRMKIYEIPGEARTRNGTGRKKSKARQTMERGKPCRSTPGRQGKDGRRWHQQTYPGPHTHDAQKAERGAAWMNAHPHASGPGPAHPPGPRAPRASPVNPGGSVPRAPPPPPRPWAWGHVLFPVPPPAMLLTAPLLIRPSFSPVPSALSLLLTPSLVLRRFPRPSVFPC